MNTDSGVKMNDPGIKTFDSVSNKGVSDSTGVKILNSEGGVLSDVTEKRRAAIEDLCAKMSDTLMSKLSSTEFNSKLDLVSNHLFELAAYAQSLKDAAESVSTNYPEDSEENHSEQSLEDVVDLCDVLQEGISRVDMYLNTVKTFGGDLANIGAQLYEQTVSLCQDL